jgi:hypothetical protein
MQFHLVPKVGALRRYFPDAAITRRADISLPHLARPALQ